MRSRIGIALFLALTLAVSACGKQYGSQDLVGSWEGTRSDNTHFVVTFSANGNCQIRTTAAGNIQSEIDGQYETDFSKSPVPVSIRNIPQLPHPIHTIIEFQNENKIRMGSFSPRWRLRPISFDHESEILLTRQHAPGD